MATELEEQQASALVLCRAALKLAEKAMTKAGIARPFIFTPALAQAHDAIERYVEELNAEGMGLSPEDRREIAAEVQQ